MVLRGDPQPVAMGAAKGGGGGVEIVERVDIRPAGGDRDDKIGMAEAQGCKLGHLPVPVGELVAHQVRSGHAHMDAARRQFARNLAGGEEDEVQPLGPLDRAGIFAFRPGTAERDATGAEPVEGLVHEPPLGRHAEFQGHDAPPPSSSISPGRSTPPTAGIARPRPSRRVSAS